MVLTCTNNPRTNGLSFEISHVRKGLVTWQRLHLRSFLSNHGLDAQVNVLAVWSCCKSRVIQNAIQNSRSSRGLYLVNAVMFPTNYQMFFFFSLFVWKCCFSIIYWLFDVHHFYLEHLWLEVRSFPEVGCQKQHHWSTNTYSTPPQMMSSDFCWTITSFI